MNIDLAKEGDILITSANGSSKLVGKHAIISKTAGKSVHGGFMLLASSDNPKFLNAFMSASWYTTFIKKFVAGGNGSIGNLNKNNLESHEVQIPCVKERHVIGQFFNQIDNLITLHQRKLITSFKKDLPYLPHDFPKRLF